MTFTDVFGFLLYFSTSWKSFEKSNDLRNYFFQLFWITVMICYSRPKIGPNIFESLKSWQITDSAKDQQGWICFQFLVSKSRAEAVNSHHWTFETYCTQNLHFYAVYWQKQPLDDQTIQFWHQVSEQFWKLWPTCF